MTHFLFYSLGLQIIEDDAAVTQPEQGLFCPRCRTQELLFFGFLIMLLPYLSGSHFLLHCPEALQLPKVQTDTFVLCLKIIKILSIYEVNSTFLFPPNLSLHHRLMLSGDHFGEN